MLWKLTICVRLKKKEISNTYKEHKNWYPNCWLKQLLTTAQSMCEVDTFKYLLHKEFEMKGLGIANKILGLEIRRDKEARNLWLS